MFLISIAFDGIGKIHFADIKTEIISAALQTAKIV
jgi:hypothetical protein